jgi:hydrogenase expression/formation protein HypC
VGDWVLVHVGFAMVRIDEHEAALTLALLRELGELQAELDVMGTSTLAAPANTDFDIVVQHGEASHGVS